MIKEFIHTLKVLQKCSTIFQFRTYFLSRRIANKMKVRVHANDLPINGCSYLIPSNLQDECIGTSKLLWHERVNDEVCPVLRGVERDEELEKVWAVTKTGENMEGMWQEWPVIFDCFWIFSYQISCFPILRTQIRIQFSVSCTNQQIKSCQLRNCKN